MHHHSTSDTRRGYRIGRVRPGVKCSQPMPAASCMSKFCEYRTRPTSIERRAYRERTLEREVLHTLFGSALMLVGFLVLGFSQGTFDMQVLAAVDITNAAISLNAVFFLIWPPSRSSLLVFPLHTLAARCAHTDRA